MRASEGSLPDGLGPIGQAVESRLFDRILLLSDLDKSKNATYKKWLASQTNTPIETRAAKLTSPTEFGEIYKAVFETVNELEKKYASDLALTFHLSPVTPAMATVWIIVAKTLFPAELIESSKQAGVRTASVPFDISAEFIPSVIRQTDEQLEKISTEFLSDAEFSDIIFQSV